MVLSINKKNPMDQPKFFSQFPGPASFPLKQNLINTGISNVRMGMPQKFQVSDGNNNFSLGRNTFINVPNCNSLIRGPFKTSIRVETNNPNCNDNLVNNNWSGISIHTNNGRRTNGKLIAGKKNQVLSSDQLINRNKNRAIGSGSSNIQEKKFSFKTDIPSNLNTINHSLRQVRGGGTVAPPKKGALENKNRTSGGGPRAVFGGGRCNTNCN